MADFYMGIDVGNRFCTICVMDQRAESVFVGRVATLNYEEWDKLLCRFKGHLRAVFEIGPHYSWMYELLKAHKAEVLVIAPKEAPLQDRPARRALSGQRAAQGRNSKASTFRRWNSGSIAA